MSHCIHFGVCGGCAVDDPAAVDKAALLGDALRQARFLNAPVASLVVTPLRSRRRVDLGCTRHGGEIALGLHRARGSEVVDMAECVLLDPRLFALLAPLRVLLRSLEGFRRAGSVAINWLDDGADVLFRLDAALSTPDRRRMIEFARQCGVVRVSCADREGEAELVAMLAAPVITLSGIRVEPAPGAFLQASQAGEAAIVAAVLAGLRAIKPKALSKAMSKAWVAELYAGSGTISFALQHLVKVRSYEGAKDAAIALDRAIRGGNLSGRMQVETRDLARRPVKPSELAGCAALVLDPPYAGAGAQMKAIAESKVPLVVYVSCNPAALGSDAAVLQRAGYQVLAATPIDQFPYSEHVESVVVFGG